MKNIVFLLIALGLFITGCSSGPEKTQKSQLQIREFQTRSYQDVKPMMVMKAMLNVLQDEGFIVKNAVPELGLLTAVKETDIEVKRKSFLSSLFSGDPRWDKNSVIEVSCNVSDYGYASKVRVNFKRKILDNKGGFVKIEQIDEQKFYQNFFNRVSKSIFIQRQDL